ncbi:MAG TPA: homoserine dehydrogenase [Polyangiaceae bacterium]|nr:homoserine dehydrogenase [Polyangiaceae bacterium]
MRVKVGLVGFGVIGTGVVSLLREHADLLKRRSGVEIVLGRIVDIDIDRPREVAVDRSLLSTDYRDIINDPTIDIVIELVGGTTIAFDVVSDALHAGKHVVTANKALLCHRGPEVFALAMECKREIRFEASVAGGIPIIKAITESLASDRIKTLYGIVNGTTNFILTRMIEDRWTFADALKRAQELGFAEADPTLDINGSDAQHKLHILASVAFDTIPPQGTIDRTGIDQLDLVDVLYAKQLGYIIKLLAIGKRHDKTISLGVRPTLVPEKCALASVKNEFNAVMLDSDYLGQALFVGKGAGARPTASAVVGDIVDIAGGMLQNREFSASRYQPFSDFQVQAAGETISRFYLRLATVERAGILAQITKILGDEDISISAIVQQEGGEPIPIVILTRHAKEENVRRAVAAIDQQSFTRGKTVVLHVEDIGL